MDNTDEWKEAKKDFADNLCAGVLMELLFKLQGIGELKSY